MKSLNQFIEQFGIKAKDLIAEYEKIKELKGEQRKNKVDELLLKWALPAIDTIPINIVFKFALKTFVKIGLPTITQVIFNLIETRVQGITK